MDINTEIRKELLLKHYKNKSPHIGSEFSCIEILTTLYFSIMKNNDRFILSKGHAAPALYAILHRKGIMSDEMYNSYGKDGSLLAEHPTYGIPGIDVATGSLGHGLSIGIGFALASKMDNTDARIFVLMGDGELQEGSVWEGMNCARRFNLDNLIVIVDNNRWQGYDRTSEIQDIKHSKNAFCASGWNVLEINGNKNLEVEEALSKSLLKNGSPKLIIADTIIGKGSRSMEDRLESHYRPPNDAQLNEGIMGA